MTNDTYGHTFGTQLACYDRESSCWKTCSDTSLWELPLSLESLPAWGITLDGVLFELPTPAPLTAEPGCSLLPTPTVVDMGSNKTAQEWQAWTDFMRERHSNGNGRSLTQEAIRLLPTPVASDSKTSYNVRSTFETLPSVLIGWNTPGRSTDGSASQDRPLTQPLWEPTDESGSTRPSLSG